jgi:hypothetical protein
MIGAFGPTSPNSNTFVGLISNFALQKIEAEWGRMGAGEAETLGRLYPLIWYVFANKTDKIVAASSFIAGAYLANIILDVPIGQRWRQPIGLVRKAFLLTLTVSNSDLWATEVSELPNLEGPSTE